MSDYEKYRVWLSFGQIIATLVSPLVIIKLTRKDKGN